MFKLFRILSLTISGMVKDGTYQVTYNDLPLYYYSKDTKAGDAKGQEVKDLWYVVLLK